MSDMSDGRVYTERHDHILKIVIDNVAKKNAFSPEMMAQLSDALTLLENDDALWVGVLCLYRRARHAEILRPHCDGQA
jgi:enoyl-CoA hydratase